MAGSNSLTSLDLTGDGRSPSVRIKASTPNHLDWPPELLRRFNESFGGIYDSNFPLPYALLDDDMRFGGTGWGRGVTGTVADRKGGRDLPIYWSEVDLRGFRVLSRWLADTNPFMIGFHRRLQDYHIRKGFQWQACIKGQKKQPYATGMDGGNPLVTKAQNILDAWRDRYSWPLRSREGFHRLRRDGEFGSRLGWERRGDLPWIRWVEPEQIGSPTGSTDDAESFGLRNAPGDVETITDYYVRDAQGDGTKGVWVPESKIVFAKTNTDSTIKRGIPDSFSVHEYMDESRKLVRNMIVVAVAQAAVAWREKFPTASVEQVRAVITGTPNTQVPPWMNGGQTLYSEKIAAGTVLRTEGSREFEPGPVSTGVASYIEAEQAALRACCVRWGFPPYMTAKADDINFASSITAGSPFAMAVEGGQTEWAAVERKVALKVLDLAYESGLLSKSERDQLDVEVIPPTVVTPDPAADSARRKTLFDAKVLDPYTWMQEEGYDPSHIEANWKAWQQRNGAVSPPPPNARPGTEPNDLPAGEWLESIMVTEGFSGTITDTRGREYHYVNGKRVAKANKDDAAAKHVEVETAVASAIGTPAGVRPEDLEKIAANLKDLTGDRLRELARQIKAKVGGKKVDLAERLLRHVRGEKQVVTKRKTASAPKTDSLYAIVIGHGGINPKSLSFLSHYSGVKEAMENGVPLGVFRNGGDGLDSIAKQMLGSGHISAEDESEAVQKLLEGLAKGAWSNHADLTVNYEQAHYEYLRQQEEMHRANEPIDAEVLRASEEEGIREAEDADRREQSESPDDDRQRKPRASGSDDFNFGANA